MCHFLKPKGYERRFSRIIRNKITLTALRPIFTSVVLVDDCRDPSLIACTQKWTVNLSGAVQSHKKLKCFQLPKLQLRSVGLKAEHAQWPSALVADQNYRSGDRPLGFCQLHCRLRKVRAWMRGVLNLGCPLQKPWPVDDIGKSWRIESRKSWIKSAYLHLHIVICTLWLNTYQTFIKYLLSVNLFCCTHSKVLRHATLP